MARPNKQGLSYFPLDVDFLSDLKVRKLIKSQGGKAIAVYTLLLCNIYKEGYYMRWDEELPFIISEQTGFEEVYVREVIKYCIVIGLISKEIFESYKILTSRGIQERYDNICKIAKRKFVISKFNLITSEETIVTSEETIVNSEEMPITSEKSTQRKGKERKEKKKENTPSIPHREDVRDVFSEYKSDLLSDDFWIESETMTSQIGVKFKENISDFVNKFFAWIVSTGEENSIQSLKDAKRRFHYWWANTGKKEYLEGNMKDIPKGFNVWIENGKKYYGSGIEIPLNAPTRASQDSKWDFKNNKWTVSGG